MAIAVLLIGAILIVSAFNNTHGQLAAELEKDIPGFFKWGIALGLIVALGFVPGLKTPSRWLLALVLLVIVVTNYQNIIAGISSFAASSGKPTGQAAADPTTAYASQPASAGPPSPAEVAGAAPGAGGSPPPAGGSGSMVAGLSFDPNSLLHDFISGAGFLGLGA